EQSPFRITPRRTARSRTLVSLVSAFHEQSDHGGQTVAFVDSHPEIGLAASGDLRARGIATIPVIQRWVVENARIPSVSLLDHLMSSAPQVSDDAPMRGYLVVLDGDRQAP